MHGIVGLKWNRVNRGGIFKAGVWVGGLGVVLVVVLVVFVVMKMRG